MGKINIIFKPLTEYETVIATITILYALRSPPSRVAASADRRRTARRRAPTWIVKINSVGEGVADGRELAPTIVIGAPQTSRRTREEIFGRLPPIGECDRLDDAMAFVDRGDRPPAFC